MKKKRRKKNPAMGRPPPGMINIRNRVAKTPQDYNPKRLQILIKPLMSQELKTIARKEGIDPVALVLLQIARYINELGGPCFEHDEY